MQLASIINFFNITVIKKYKHISYIYQKEKDKKRKDRKKTALLEYFAHSFIFQTQICI